MGKGKIEYDLVGIDRLDMVKPLWEKLNRHHLSKAHYFREHFKKQTFEQRIKNILDKSGKADIHILLAKDLKTGEYIGYCISTVEKDAIGEVDSLFVEENYRGLGVGENFMNDALEWMKSMDVKKYKVVVAEGNEDVFQFYNKFGFYHSGSILTKKE